MPNNIFDRFSFIVALIVALLIFIDWLLYKSEKEKLKDKVLLFWLYIEDTTFNKFLVDEATRITLTIKSLLGSAFTLKYLYRSFFLFLGFNYFALYSSWLYFEKRLSFDNIQNAFVIPNTISCSISLLFTMIILKILLKHPNIISVFVLIVLDFAISFFLISFVFVSVLIINNSTTHHKPEPSVIQYINDDVLAVGFVISLTPTLLHILFLIVFVFLKVTWPVIKPLTLRVSHAIYESNNGVLSIIAVAMGAISKLIQLAINAA